jgi:hypothetical protein
LITALIKGQAIPNSKANVPGKASAIHSLRRSGGHRLEGVMKNVSVSKTKGGEYFLSLQVAVEIAD